MNGNCKIKIKFSILLGNNLYYYKVYHFFRIISKDD